MTRDIKFRCWDKVNKQMFIPIFLMVDEKSGNHEAADLDFEKNRKYDIDGYLDGGLYTDNNEHWILMQFTGLKDKSGKEIYEGDIVKHRNGVHKVEYVEEFCSFQMGLSDHVLDQEVGDYSEVEIIGNIYENPELLKEEK